jgi:hypothetical protein
MFRSNLVNFHKMQEMNISKATFRQSAQTLLILSAWKVVQMAKPESTESHCIFLSDRFKIFILAYGCFCWKLAGFSSNLFDWAPRNQNCKPYIELQLKYSNFHWKTCIRMTDENFLDRFRTFRAVKLQPVWSYRHERCLISPKRTSHKMRKSASFKFRQLWEGIFSLLFVSRTKTRVLRTRVDLCYHRGPFPACVGKVYKLV